jgi:hypothetical protein
MHSTLIQAGDFLPGLPPLSIITVVGVGILACCIVLYCLSRIRELLLIGGIAALYAIVPVIGMMKHM